MAIRKRRIDEQAEIARGSAQAGRRIAELEPIDGGGPVLASQSVLRLAQQAAEGPSVSGKFKARYVTQADERVRPGHAALHGTEWDLDDPNRPVPPLGYGCRCYIEVVAVDEEVAAMTGTEQAVSNPPEPGSAEAYQGFYADAKNSKDGEPVTPIDTFGPTVGKEIEAGTIKPEDAIDDGLNPVPATVLKQGANEGGSLRAINAARRAQLQLQGMGVTLGQARKVRALAREYVDEFGGTDKNALTQVLIGAKPGFIAGRTVMSTEARAKVAASHILKMLGPL